MSLTWLTQICGNHYDWSVTIAQIYAKALIGPSQKSKSEEQNIVCRWFSFFLVPL